MAVKQKKVLKFSSKINLTFLSLDVAILNAIRTESIVIADLNKFFLLIGRAAITSLFLRFVLFLKVCALENIFVLISKKCPYFDLCPYFCFILGLEVLIPGTSIN